MSVTLSATAALYTVISSPTSSRSASPVESMSLLGIPSKTRESVIALAGAGFVSDPAVVCGARSDESGGRR